VAATTVDAYVKSLPDEQGKIVEELRRIVRVAAPQSRESIKWAQPVYEHFGPFAYIKAFKSYVNFGFWRGVEIDGGRGQLLTGGSKMAHLSLRSASDINPAQLVRMVREAVRLNEKLGDPTRE
jgi:hypothetical protein